MKITNYKGLRLVEFSSIQDAVKAPVPNPENRNTFTYYALRCGQSDQLDWLGLYLPKRDTVDEVLARFQAGWSEGLKRAESCGHQMTLPKVKKPRRVRRRGDFGDVVDMQRIYAGDVSRAWQRTHRVTKVAGSGGLVTVVCEMSMNCSRKAEEMFWRGSVAIAIIDELQATGRRVRLLVKNDAFGLIDESPDTKVQLVYEVKGFSQPLSKDRVMMATGCAGFFRIIGFRGLCTMPETVCPGLGYPEHDVPLHPSLNIGQNIMIPSTITDRGSASAFVKTVAERFHIE